MKGGAKAMKVTQYDNGVPNWTDLGSPDLEGRRAGFYAGVFGWDPRDMGPDSGGYIMFHQGGRGGRRARPTAGSGPAAGLDGLRRHRQRGRGGGEGGGGRWQGA